MANTRERRTRQEYALLTIAEWLRDEVRFGSVANARHSAKFEELRDLAFKALGDPTLKDADAIRARHAQLTGSPDARPEERKQK
jgi:hypothetical protein